MLTVDDATILELRRTVETHHDGRGYQALEALAMIRDDRALLHIHAIAARAKGKVQKRALQILEEVSRQRGLSPDELEDRIVPDLGLDEHGALTLDYGPRQFTVGFDEQLEPFVRDTGGNRLAAIPRAAKDDDAEKAHRAAERWKMLKHEVSSIGKEQARRLERSMVAQRHWTAASFATFLVKHRLLGHFTRRIVWSSDGVSFRVTEDGTYASDVERPVELPDAARIVAAHPVLLDEETRGRWRQILLDYEILQPFPQVDRPMPAPTAEELHTTSTSRFKGMQVHARRLWSLKHRGWTLSGCPTKQLGPRVRAYLDLEPRVDWFQGHPANEEQEHEVGSLTLTGKTFAALDLITRTELLADVERLRE